MEGRENGALSTGAGGLPGECRLSRVSCRWADLGGGVTIEEGAYVRTERQQGADSFREVGKTWSVRSGERQEWEVAGEGCDYTATEGPSREDTARSAWNK